ncbi:MAG: hypothetical protein AB1656_18655 [Candidatus Omnitrophota bacterium]
MGKLSIRKTDRKAGVAAVFSIAALCAIGALCLSASQNELKPPTPAKKTAIDFQPIRGEFRPLRLRLSGFEYQCSECHEIIESQTERHTLIAEHMNIKLDHGRNDYCLNCHLLTNRNAYAAHDGSEIPANRPAELCGKCHGLVYRDWLAGAHGKFIGYWDPRQGERQRLLCIQCHDPHAPKFPKIAPMPRPAKGREYKIARRV